MKWSDYIISDNDISLGKPTIKGTRISVEHIINLKANGWTEQQILDNNPTLNQVSLQAVFSYFQDCTQNIDEMFEEAIAKKR